MCWFAGVLVPASLYIDNYLLSPIPFWSILSHGPKRLTFNFQILWSTELVYIHAYLLDTYLCFLVLYARLHQPVPSCPELTTV